MGYGIDDLGGGIVGLVIFALLVITAILWFFLPFAVLGIKGKLDSMLAVADRAEKRLAAIEAQLAKEPAPAPSVRPDSVAQMSDK